MAVQASRLFQKRLGQVLLDEGLLTLDQVRDALKRQRATGEALSEALVDLGLATELEVARCVVKHHGLPYLDVTRYEVSSEALKSAPRELQWLHQFVVLDRIGKTLVIAVSGTISSEVLEKVERDTGCRAFVYVGTPAGIMGILRKELPLNGQAGA